MIYLDDEVGKWQGLDTYLDAKKKLSGGVYSTFWRLRYSHRKSVGSCVYLCEKWNPTSYEDFYNKYIESGVKDIDVDKKERGRTVEEIEEIAVNWRNDCHETTLPLETFFYGVIVHVIVETFQGRKHENDVIDQLLKSGLKVAHGNDDEDALMNIDLKVYDKDNTLKYLIQVKPIRFITSMRGDVVLDKINAFAKNRKALEKYPECQLFYVIYDNLTDKWIVNTKWKRCIFLYNDLVDSNGKNKMTESVMKSNESANLFKS